MRISPGYLVLFALALVGSIGAGCGTGNINSSGTGGAGDPSTGDLQPNDVGGSDSFSSGSLMPPGVWSKRYGDAEDQRTLAVAMSGSGAIALAGEAKGTVNFGNLPWPGSATDTDVVVAKISSEGQALWSRRYGDSCDQRGSAVANAPSGNVLVAGDFCGKMDFGTTTVETQGAEIDVFVAMIDTLGEDVYSRSFGGKGAQIMRGAAVDASGNAVLVGSFDQAFDAGLGAAETAGLDDSFVIMLDPKGNVLWSLTFGGPESDVARGVAFDPLGNIVVGGSFGGSVDFGGGLLTAGAGHSGGFVVELDSTGKHLWSKSFVGDGDVVVNAVAAGPQGKVAMTGYYLGTADLGGGPTTSHGAEDAFVEVMSSAGDHVWGSAFGGPKLQRATGVTFGVASDVVISGVSDELLVPGNLFPGAAVTGDGPPDFVGTSMAYAVRFTAVGDAYVFWDVLGAGPLECIGVGYDGNIGMMLAGSFKQSLSFQFSSLPPRGRLGHVSRAHEAVTRGSPPLAAWPRSTRLLSSSAGGWNAAVQRDHRGALTMRTVGLRLGLGLVLGASTLTSLSSSGCTGRIAPQSVGDLGGSSGFSTGEFAATGGVGTGLGPLPPPTVWVKDYGDADDQHLSAFAVNPAGEIALVGSARGTVDFGNIPWAGAKTDTDVVVAKLSTEGQALWSRRYGDSCDQRAGAVALMPSGNVLIAGDFCGKMDFGATSVATTGGEVDLFVAVLDTLGEDVYSARVGGKGAQIARAAVADADGSVVIVGSFDQGFDDGTGEAASAGMDDAFVLKLDPAGKVLWSRRFGGPEADIARAVAMDSTGNLVVGGSFGGSVDFGGAPLTAGVGLGSGFVLALDPDGTTLWSRSFGGDGEAGVSGVAIDATDNIAATGFFAGTADFGGGAVTSAGAEDMFVTLMSNAGTTVWEATFGGPKSQRGGGVTFTPSGEVVASATSEEVLDLVPIGSEIPISRPPTWVGPSTIYTVKLSADGKLGGGWEMMSTAPVECAGVGYDEKAGTILAGSFKETIDYQLGAVDSRGGWDMFVARQ
jgi:hypothetical protein